MKFVREFDTDDIRMMAAFENITGSAVRDCLRFDSVYFVVNQGKIGIAIGKGGQTIKTAEKLLGKSIKIFEWSQDVKQFVKNLIPQAKNVEVKNDTAIVSVDSKERGIVIGKSGSNIKVLKEILRRNTNLKELKIL